MADSKVSELTAATSAGSSDLLYLVQSNTSKKISVANFFSSVGDITLAGNISIGGSSQTLASPGNIRTNTPITHLTADATGGLLTIGQGTTGQTKYIVMVATSGGSYNISANVAGGGTITFDHVGASAQLLFTNTKWYLVGGTASVTY